MRASRLMLLLPSIGLALVLAGCGLPAPTPTPTPTTIPSDSSAAPTPNPTVDAARVVVTVDSVVYEHDGRAEEVSLRDGEEVVALLEQIAGAATVEEFDGPYDTAGGVRYAWDGVSISVWTYDSRGFLNVGGPTIGGIPIATAEGISVGSTRDEALAAEAFELCQYDGDGDGKPDSLAMHPEEVPDALSLCRPDAVGIEYVELGFAGDLVTRLSAPSNDFSDI
ncbi:hypothetical protein [Microbacterium lacus]|uniref:Uncharacterized protein n=1 Tax=Microbacterium lacus TaxID=415217 RepID=A0ABN2G0K1_9MICO